MSQSVYCIFILKVFGTTPTISVVKQHEDVDQVIAHQTNFTFFIRKCMIRQDVDIMEISCLAVSQECPFSIYTHGPLTSCFVVLYSVVLTLWLVAHPRVEHSHYSALCEISLTKCPCPWEFHYVLWGSKDVHFVVFSRPGFTYCHEQVTLK